jgi:hypothetical protein
LEGAGVLDTGIAPQGAEEAAGATLDTIPSIGSGEPVDLNAALGGVAAKATTAADLDGYVTLDTTSDPGHTIVMVDPHGAGNYQPFVKLVDVTNFTLQELLDSQHHAVT